MDTKWSGHPVAYTECCDGFADRGYTARVFVALGNVPGGCDGVPPMDLLEIGAVHGTAQDLDQHLVTGRLRNGDVGDRLFSIGIESYGLHQL